MLLPWCQLLSSTSPPLRGTGSYRRQVGFVVVVTFNQLRRCHQMEIESTGSEQCTGRLLVFPVTKPTWFASTSSTVATVETTHAHFVCVRFHLYYNKTSCTRISSHKFRHWQFEKGGRGGNVDRTSLPIPQKGMCNCT